MSEQVKFAVVGAGNIGNMHINNLYNGKISGAALTAVCDIDTSKLAGVTAKYPGVAAYRDYDEMLAKSGADAVIIAVPHYFHHEMAIKAFKAGFHVLTEKPAGVRVSDVKLMNKAADESGKVFGIMFNQRTNPLFAKAREIMKSGEMGAPKRLTWIITNWYRTQSYYDSGSWRATWDLEGGGVLTNQSPHNLDLAQWIFGMPDRIRAFCKEGLYHHITVEDEAVIYGEYKNGATMQFITTTGEFPGTNRLEIATDGGKMVIEGGKLKIWRLKSSERDVCFNSREGMPQIPFEYSEILPDRPETAHCGIIQNFVGAINGENALLADGREGINQVTLSTGAYMSSWTNDWVELPIDEERFNALLEEKRTKERSGQSFHKEPGESAGESMLPRWSVNW